VTSITHAAIAAVGARRGVRAATLASVFGAMLGLGCGFSLKLLNPWEGWFLQVVARMRDGDLLYRDISYGAGPLPAYLTEAATYLVSVDILAVKLVVVGAVAPTATLAWLIADELGIGRNGKLLLLAAVAYFSPPLQQPPYAPLATTFLLAALLVAIQSRRAPGRGAALAGGAACALAFCSKQNAGVYALAALAVVYLVSKRPLAALWAAVSFAGVTFVVLLPVALTGGLPRYLDYGFTGKGAYLHAPGPFASTLTGVARTVGDVHSLAGADAAYWALGFFLPVVALAALPFVRGAPKALPVVLFAAASAATLFPRFDTAHVAYAAPPLVLLVGYALHEWHSRVHRLVIVAVAAWVGIAAVLMATLPIRLARSPEANLSTLPHLRGAFVQREEEAAWHAEGAKLIAAAHGNRSGLLLLVPDAGFLYLITGLRNPTPFDFPFVTTFGRNGQQQVVDALASGRIARVCVAGEWFGLEPAVLVRFVRATMQPGADLGICRLYSRRAG
jgi:hypothetical protein